MRKCLSPKALLAFLTAVLITFTGSLGYAQSRDNLGRPISEPAAAGVLSGASADSTTTEIPGYERHMFDLGINIAAAGADDDSSGTEQAILGWNLLWYPSDWMKFGVGMDWNQADREAITFSVPVYFYLFPDPQSTVKWFFSVNPASYTVRTSPLEGQLSPWSFDPSGSFGVEFPMGGYALAGRVGAQYIQTQEGVDKNQFRVGAGATLFFRLGR